MVRLGLPAVKVSCLTCGPLPTLPCGCVTHPKCPIYGHSEACDEHSAVAYVARVRERVDLKESRR